MKTNILSISLILSLLLFSDCDFGLGDWSSDSTIDISDIGNCCFGSIRYFDGYIPDTFDIVQVEVDTLIKESLSSMKIDFNLTSTEDVRIVELQVTLYMFSDIYGYEHYLSHEFYNFTDLDWVSNEYDEMVDDPTFYTVKDSIYNMSFVLDDLAPNKEYQGRNYIQIINPYDTTQTAITGLAEFKFGL